MTFSPLTSRTSGNAGQFSARGRSVDRIILHHCASTSLAGVLSMMATGSREVSANYVIGSGGEIVGVVPEEFRAWTSSSSSWDGRAITFEIVNETGAPEWRISDLAFAAVASMLADLSARYGIPLSRETVVTHQELYNIHGASYATACPGPYLQARIDQLIELARARTGAPVIEEEPIMAVYLRATGNSSPIDAKNPGSSRIWAGDNRDIGGARYSGVWERSDDGSLRRLFPGEWAAIQQAYTNAGRKIPFADISGNELEKMYLVKRAEPKR